MNEIIKIISAANAEHYNWAENCDGWHFLKNDGLSIIQEKMPPGTSEVMHYHQGSRQFFYILAGIADIIIEDKEYTLMPGDGIEVPPLMPHKIYNDSNEELNFLVISQPKSHGDRIVVED
jgi:mannose-6-phosphate isomerase-like protein (cupin superfamily)